jgi:poly(hydroxyalkanoate) depolymerase family esterase
MNLIDWRDLYASNLAAIEGARGDAPGVTTLLPEPGVSLPELPGAIKARLPELPGGIKAGLPELPGAIKSRLPVSLPALPGGVGLDLPALPRSTPADEPGWERLEYREGGRARPFHVYTPPELPAGAPAPLLVLLHGCTQTPRGFASDAAMPRLADRHGFVLLCPEQTPADNQQGCWNWFQPAHQARGAGDPAFIAGAARAVMAEDSRWSIDPERVYVAGLSAGGAMAAIMAVAYPDVFAAAAIHSGLAYRSATNMGAAFQAMTTGGADPADHGRAALEAMGSVVRPVPTIVLHGTADRTVCPVNGEQVVRQWIATNRLAAPDRYRAEFERPAETLAPDADGRHPSTRRRWRDEDGRLMQEYVVIEGLGHAWSGGAAGGSFTDPRGPSATDAMWAFFAEAGAAA